VYNNVGGDCKKKMPVSPMSRDRAKAARKVPRAYLRADERRERFLAVAADLVGKRGWGALGMLPLATAAGVSRQLVYEHFANTSDLLIAVTHHLFEGARAATSRIMAATADDMGSVIRRAYEIYIDLPRAQRRALRSLAGDSEPDSPEVGRVRHLMREEILGLWVPFVRRQTNLAEPAARALAWMFLTGAWGLTDLVEDGALSTAEAEDLLITAFAGAITAMGRSGRRGERRRRISRSAPRRPRRNPSAG